MAAKGTCENCGKAISAPDSYSRKHFKCPRCKNYVLLLKPGEKVIVTRTVPAPAKPESDHEPAGEDTESIGWTWQKVFAWWVLILSGVIVVGQSVLVLVMSDEALQDMAGEILGATAGTRRPYGFTREEIESAAVMLRVSAAVSVGLGVLCFAMMESITRKRWKATRIIGIVLAVYFGLETLSTFVFAGTVLKVGEHYGGGVILPGMITVSNVIFIVLAPLATVVCIAYARRPPGAPRPMYKVRKIG